MAKYSADERLTQAKTGLLSHVPFFASLLLDMMRIEISSNLPFKTAATDGKTIWFHPEFLEKHTLPEVAFVMCHEVAHAMWMHMARADYYQRNGGPDGKPFNLRKFNVAADYVINDMLINSKIGAMPECGLHDKKYTYKMTAEEVYRDMPDPPSKPQSGDEGEGDSIVQAEGHGGFDRHIPSSQGGNPQTGGGEAEWKRAVASAAAAAKAAGRLPGAIETFVNNLLEPTIPWQEHLRKTLTKAIGRDSNTWSKLHRRRYVTQGVIMPGYTGFGAGHVVIAIDTSGSVSDHELVVFLSELQAILDDCQPARVDMLAIDTRVTNHVELYAGDSLVDTRPALKGRGGTEFWPAFDWVEKQGFVPAALVYFTDMGGAFPEPPDYPVVWASSTGGEAPFGETIHVEIGSEQ